MDFASLLAGISIESRFLLWADETRWADRPANMGLQTHSARQSVAAMTVLRTRPAGQDRESLAKSIGGDSAPIADASGDSAVGPGEHNTGRRSLGAQPDAALPA